VLGLGCAGFASTFTMRAFDPLVPTLAGIFERSIPTIAAVASTFSIFYAISQPFLGPVADSVGKVRTILTCLIGLLILSCTVALAFNFPMLLVARTATGIAAGGIIPVGMALIGDRAPMRERQIVLGRFLVIMLLGQMGGATMSGLIGEHFGWRAVFVLAGVIAGLAALALWRLVPMRRDIERPALSVSGAIGNYREVFANPRSKLLYGLVIAEGALVFGMPPYIAAILQERSGVGALEAGLVIGGGGLGGLIYGLSIRAWMRWLGPARMAILGGALMALAYMVFAFNLPWWTGIPLFIVQGLGFFLLHGTFQAEATELAPQSRASAVALFACFLFCGHALGPLAFGAMLQAFGASAAILVFAALVAMLGAITPAVLGLRGR
jgi:MFS transporter, YNFM family, putative membrane transport protein